MSLSSLMDFVGQNFFALLIIVGFVFLIYLFYKLGAASGDSYSPPEDDSNPTTHATSAPLDIKNKYAHWYTYKKFACALLVEMDVNARRALDDKLRYSFRLRSAKLWLHQQERLNSTISLFALTDRDIKIPDAPTLSPPDDSAVQKMQELLPVFTVASEIQEEQILSATNQLRAKISKDAATGIRDDLLSSFANKHNDREFYHTFRFAFDDLVACGFVSTAATNTRITLYTLNKSPAPSKRTVSFPFLDAPLQFDSRKVTAKMEFHALYSVTSPLLVNEHQYIGEFFSPIHSDTFRASLSYCSCNERYDDTSIPCKHMIRMAIEFHRYTPMY